MNIITIISIVAFLAATIYIVFLKVHYNFELKNGESSGSKAYHTEQIDNDILHAISDSVIICAANGTISSMNEAAAKITGWAINDAENLDFQSVLTFIDQQQKQIPRDKSHIQLALEGNTTVRQTLPIMNRSSKQSIFVDVSVSPTTINGGQGVIAILRDVDNQVKQDTERSDFISTASHEMRTPVAAIRGFLELALNPKICQIDDNARKHLNKAHNATEHLGKLFQDLLTASRSEDGRLPNNPVKVNINNFIKELAEQLNFTAQAKNLSLTIQVDGANINQPSVIKSQYFGFVDPDRLHEVITGLFDNAVKYTQKGGVGINLHGTQDSLSIDIRDSGLGIPKDDLPHIFQKFYRVDNTSTREIGGTGLGLYICKEIVETMHGTIQVTSTEGVGSTFTITIPRVY